MYRNYITMRCVMALQREKYSIRFNFLLSESQEKRLTAAAQAKGISRSAFIRLALEQALADEKETALEKAVRELTPLYETDQDLTDFTSLDGEDFS
jgi:Arc/MetJ-type ribon-helix-helix transcriptional regulator